MADKVEIDPQLQRFIAVQQQKVQFNTLVHEMTERCWDTCITGSLGARLDRRSESCITNCVERFIDTSNYVINRMEREGEQHLKTSQSEEFGKW